MPIMQCTTGGKKGYKYGPNGTCYPGKAGLGRARAQGVAIELSQRRRRSKNAETYLIGK